MATQVLRLGCLRDLTTEVKTVNRIDCSLHQWYAAAEGEGREDEMLARFMCYEAE